MSISTPLYNQLFRLLSQHSNYRDLRHLKALVWMIIGLIHSGKISLSQWECYIPSRARKAQSFERRWQRFVGNQRIRVRNLSVPLVLGAIKNWHSQRLYLALDTTMLWNRFCIIHLSIVCGGRAIPFLWKVLEHKSSTVAFAEYKIMLRLAAKLLSDYSNIMLLADRGFANHELVNWLQNSTWHYCLRLPCDVILHGVRRHPIELKYLCPPKAQAVLCHDVGLSSRIPLRIWLDRKYRCNVVLANVKGVKEPWAVITDENPSLQTLWQYGLRFRVEELFLDSKSGVFQLEDSKIRHAKALERLYLIVAIALLFATCHGMTLQLKGLRTQVDPHWKRGLSYLKIGLRWLKGVLSKGRDLFFPTTLLSQDVQPCFVTRS